MQRRRRLRLRTPANFDLSSDRIYRTLHDRNTIFLVGGEDVHRDRFGPTQIERRLR